MEVYCTRPSCPRPLNQFADLDDSATLRTVQQKFCTACGMPLVLAGRYVPQKLLGKGGFGAAFLARDRYTPAMRRCVVKEFQPAGELSPAQLQVAQKLFEREGEVLEQLGNNHPQIPDLLAFFEIDAPSRVAGKPERFFYLVQEFIDGDNLEEELEQQGAFSEAAMVEVLREMLKVLKYVHENGSIHRDIKPSNIMRRKDGRLFLLDFGAVKQVAAGAAATPGKASTGIYSMGFAPPEQMRGDHVYPATDLYALAVTCITLLTGKSPSELYDSYSNDWNWKPHAQISDRLADVLDRLLLPTPSARFQSAEAAMEALQAALAPAAAPAPSTPLASPQSRAAAVAASPSASSTAMQAAAAPPPSLAVPAASAPTPAPAAVKPFSLLEFLGGAMFTGTEGGLLAIALLSVLGTTLVNPVFWLLLLGVMGGLAFAQSRRWIERTDLFIIAGITLVLVLFLPFLNDFAPIRAVGSVFQTVLITAIFAGLFAVAVGIIFRLVYLMLSKFL